MTDSYRTSKRSKTLSPGPLPPKPGTVLAEGNCLDGAPAAAAWSPRKHERRITKASPHMLNPGAQVSLARLGSGGIAESSIDPTFVATEDHTNALKSRLSHSQLWPASMPGTLGAHSRRSNGCRVRGGEGVGRTGRASLPRRGRDCLSNAREMVGAKRLDEVFALATAI